ncbi:hypothetical protein BCR42DRAFT_399352 [Absidia repens]|uniref:Sorting nexin-4 n=1 Tax=Absidia repens TaxID=90262 RepID=A0A1X2IZW7_9FUNG|nr:hypothetical protein BCR42DRAFT_399352 [Absidia repens]
MDENYENVEWNVHAVGNSLTPQMDTPDPLSSFDTPYETQAGSSLYPEQTNVYDDNPHSLITPLSSSNNDAGYSNNSTDVASSARSPPPYYVATPMSSSNIPSSSSHGSIYPTTAKVAKPMIIQIGDAQKHSVGTQGAYVSYLVSTTTSVDIFSATNPRPVRRRFQDFVWLYEALCFDYPACIVPSLPEKHRLEYIKGDRFSSDFIERRKLCLQLFLDRIAKHPVLQQSQCTRLFLESSDFKNDKRAQSQHVSSSTTVLDSLSDTLLNAFTKVKKPEERFLMMKEYIDKSEDNLNTVERLYTRISKRQHDLHNDYTSFGNSIQGLSALESNIQQPLHHFAETTKSYAKAMKMMSDQEEVLYLNQIHELLSYCRSAKAVLRDRDQKQMDFEDLSTYLQQAMQDKERTKHPGRSLNNGADGGSINIPELVMDKIKEVRGMDMERARREKLVHLEMKIKELQDEVARTNDISHDFSEQVVDEYNLFQQNKTNEIKRGFTAYADSHVEFYQKGISIWEQILPTLEAIEVDGNTSDSKQLNDVVDDGASDSFSISRDDEDIDDLVSDIDIDRKLVMSQ